VSKIPEWAKEMARDLVIYPEVGEDGRPYLASDDHETIALALVAAEKRGIERATASIEQAFKDGVEYATIVAVPNTAEDREHAWSISRARAAIRRLGEPHEAARAGK
jgi:hypothetical protein